MNRNLFSVCLPEKVFILASIFIANLSIQIGDSSLATASSQSFGDIILCFVASRVVLKSLLFNNYNSSVHDVYK